MLGGKVLIDINEGINIIQARIIDLTSQKLRLEADKQHYETRIELGIAPKNLAVEKTRLRKIVSKLEETNRILEVNKNLLPYTNEHEYQLEN